MNGRDGARPSQNRKDGLSPVRGLDEAGPSQDGEANVPQWMMEALSEALNEIQNDCRKVKLALAMLPPEDRRLAYEFMELLSWQKVAARRGMSEGTFRRHVLAGFIARFKDAWRKIS